MDTDTLSKCMLDLTFKYFLRCMSVPRLYENSLEPSVKKTVDNVSKEKEVIELLAKSYKCNLKNVISNENIWKEASQSVKENITLLTNSFLELDELYKSEVSTIRKQRETILNKKDPDGNT